MGLSGISKSTVFKLCKDIDERVNEFLDRPLIVTSGHPTNYTTLTDVTLSSGCSKRRLCRIT
jgi:hypothetical protein